MKAIDKSIRESIDRMTRMGDDNLKYAAKVILKELDVRKAINNLDELDHSLFSRVKKWMKS